jgi:hypothetical protein
MTPTLRNRLLGATTKRRANSQHYDCPRAHIKTGAHLSRTRSARLERYLMRVSCMDNNAIVNHFRTVSSAQQSAPRSYAQQ